MFNGGSVNVCCESLDSFLFACDSGATEQGRRLSTSATGPCGQMRGPCRRHAVYAWVGLFTSRMNSRSAALNVSTPMSYSRNSHYDVSVYDRQPAARD